MNSNTSSQSQTTPEQYEELYKESLSDPSSFWGNIAFKELEWFSPWNKVLDYEHPNYKWFVGAKLNITHNCLDRHAKGANKNKKALKLIFHKH